MIRRICISQRVDLSSTNERRDALDQEWTELLATLGMVPVPVPNRLADPAAYVQALGCEAMILSGGNDVLAQSPDFNADRQQTESALLEWAAHEKRPVLGVCRGLQMMNVARGGTLRRIEGHVGRNHRICLANGETIIVNSFHNWGIAAEDLAPGFHAAATSEEGWIEAAVHNSLPWAGIMWHPERAIDDRQRHAALVGKVLNGVGFQP